MAFVSIAYSDIPVYLRDSAFYLSLSADEPDEIIEIPAEFYKPNDLISNEQDLIQLLCVIKFWGVDTIPNSLTQYLLENKLPEIELLNDQTSQIFVDISCIFQHLPNGGSRLSNAITKKRTEVVHYLIEKKVDVEKHEAVGTAAMVGRVDYLTVLFAHGYTGDGKNEFSKAAHADHVHCLQFLHERSGTLPDCVVAAAIAGDSPACLEYIYRHCYPVKPTMSMIVLAGSAKCLACAYQHGEAFLENMCTQLIKASSRDNSWMEHCNHVECLEYVLTHGYTPEPGMCKFACDNGTLDMLRVLLKHDGTADQACATVAAKSGHLDVLSFLHDINCPWGEDTTTEAAMAGHLDCLRYAVDHSCAVHKDILLYAARRNQVHILQYLIEEQGMYMPENNALFEAAFERFHFESVAYLIDIGCPFADFQFFWLSALQPLNDSQYLKCIVYAVEHGWKHPASLMPTVKRVVHALPDCYKYLDELCSEDAT